MHPALYAAVTAARESEIRSVRRHELPPRRARQPLFSIRIALRTRRLARA